MVHGLSSGFSYSSLDHWKNLSFILLFTGNAVTLSCPQCSLRNSFLSLVQVHVVSPFRRTFTPIYSTKTSLSILNLNTLISSVLL